VLPHNAIYFRIIWISLQYKRIFGTEFAPKQKDLLDAPIWQGAWMSDSSDNIEDLRSAFSLLTELVPAEETAAFSLRHSPATVYTTLTTLLILTLQRLSKDQTLQAVVRDVLSEHTYLFPNNKRVREGTLSANPSAFSKARQKLSVQHTENFCDAVAKAIIDRGPASFQDRKIFVIDGTTIALSPSSELTEVYPPATNQFGKTVWPIMMITVAHELYSGAALRPEFGAKFGEDNTSEAEQIEVLAQRIEPNSILLADAGYGIFRVVYGCRQARQDMIVRLTNSRFKTMKRNAQLIAEHGAISHYRSQWKPTSKDRKNNPNLPENAHVWIEMYSGQTSKGEPLHVASTIDLLPEKAFELYGLRYTAVEHDIRDIKTTLNLDRMAAQSDDMVCKEILCSMVAYNLIVQFRKQAASKANLPPRRISFTRCYDTIRFFLFNFGDNPLERWLARYDQAIKLASKDVLPIRPGRSFARKAHPKRPKSTNEQRHRKPKKTIPTQETKPDT
jgi:hypothetical protein